MARLIEQLGGAIGVGVGVFVLWQLVLCFLPELWSCPGWFKNCTRFKKRACYTVGNLPKSVQKQQHAVGEVAQSPPAIGVVGKNFYLGSQEVEARRRQDAFRAFLRRACESYLIKEGMLRATAEATAQGVDNAGVTRVDSVALALESDGIITKEHLLQLSEHDKLLDRVLTKAVAAGKHTGLQVLILQPYSGEDAPCRECGLNKQEHKNIQRLAQTLVIEASRPLPKTHDPKVLLRGVSTLITLNVFLASAVFIGLSLAAPNDIQATLQTAYCDLTQQLVQVTANITGRSPIFTRASNWSAADTRAWQGAFQRRSQLFSCPESGRAFPDPSPWLNGCTGDEKMKPELMTQQIIAFALFLGSTGVAFGLLLSVQPEGELNQGWERCVTWFPYICFSGVATLLGLVFLLWSLITMAEVQYGPWQNWYGCGIPWLSHLAVCFISFEVLSALVGTACFFNGWKVA